MFKKLRRHLNWCRTITSRCSFVFTRKEMRTGSNHRSVAWMQTRTCKYSDMSVCAPEYCDSVSYAETEQSLHDCEGDRPATQVRSERAQELDPQDSPTTSAVVSASSDSLLSALGLVELTSEKKNPPASLHLKLAVCCVWLFHSPRHRLFSASTHIWSKQNPLCVVQSVLNPEQDLISRPDPPFSPAFPCVSCRKSQSASICISCNVILRPWMLKLQFTPFHILSLFLGLMQVSLILACAGLRFVCSSTQTASQTRALLVFYHLSSVQLALLQLEAAGPH